MRTAKKLLLVVLVVVMVLTGIPLLGGMAMADCPDCDLGALIAGACVVAMFATPAAVGAQLSSELRWQRLVLLGRLAADRLERPPRLA